MGSELHLSAWVTDDASARAAFAAVFAEFDRLDALLSVWREGSAAGPPLAVLCSTEAH